MSKITALEPQKKNPGRVNVYLDGEFAFGLTHIVSAWLKVGQELSEERIASLRAEDEREIVYQKALHFLSFRPRSEAEVRGNLLRRKVPDMLVEETISRLREARLVNDEAFAQAWVENRSEFRPRSRTALKMELRRKGLDDNAIQSVLKEIPDEESLALEAARKYSRKLQGLERLEFRNKLGGFLARRGFAYSTIAPVVMQMWEELHPAGENKDKENLWTQ